MCKFVSFNSEYFEFVSCLYNKFKKYLEDDYSEDTLASLIERTTPFFWVILSGELPAGFVYLENFIGNNKKLHSAEVTTCIHPEYWGTFSKYCAKIFFKKCFEDFGFQKIKALVYPQNFRVKALLKVSGFEKEAELKQETLKFGKLQNVEIYSLFRTYYEVNEDEN